MDELHDITEGTYRSSDVVDMLRRHVEPQSTRTRFEIILADDFSAHKTEPMRDLVWGMGAFLLTLGGGATGGQQPCDVALNQVARRQHGFLEANIKTNRAMVGDCMAHITEFESMCILRDVWRNEQVHLGVAEGFKQCGLSNDLCGSEDNKLATEAAEF